MLSWVKYYDEGLYDITLNSNQKLELTPSKSTSSIKFLVVARKHYQEFLESYPIDDVKEVRRALALKYVDKIAVKYLLCNKENGQSKVNVWRFNLNIPSSLFTIPESALLLTHAKPNQLLTVTDNQNDYLYLSLFNNVVYSSEQNQIIKSPAIFTLSAGIAPDNEIKVQKEKLIKLISVPYKDFSLVQLMNFIKPLDTVFTSKLAKRIVMPLLGVFFANMLLLSGYLVYQEKSLESSIEQYNEQFSTMLKDQQELNRNLQRFEELSEFFEGQIIHFPFLIMLPELMPQIKITNIRISEGRYILRGYANSALDILTFMNNHHIIENAKFDFPINKGGKQEFFVISFTSISFKELMDHTQNNNAIEKVVANG